ncbi:hypothetical protein NC653_021765 [Populus alba x Populus x berolinensis]|uniref:Uncharacterized protein n=1 Tax=Populus alba x Populus x berolinensis TaxID=444605 RepID=A0AAD6MQA8_9ROSI|nr:hypothetical protein NC653_021765 [Populus alba x Populus x berolinensis]
MACRDAMKTAVNKASSNVIMETEAWFVGDAFRAILVQVRGKTVFLMFLCMKLKANMVANWVSKAVRQLNNCGLGS